MLQKELDNKNQQIAKFQERDRETNILLQQTTNKLVLLTEDKKATPRNDEAVTVYSSPANEEGSQPQTVYDTVDKPSGSKPKRESLWDKMRKPLFQR